MKHPLRLLVLAALVLSACAPRPAQPAAPALPTIAADLPTTLAAFQLAATATSAPTMAPSPIPPATPTPHAYPALATPELAMLVAPILGRHVVQPGETLLCIARAYDVLPAAIAQANGLALTFILAPGQTLQIPGVPWTNVPVGPACAAQFQSPFPGLPAPTALPANPYPAQQALQASLNFDCVANCGSKDGSYVVRVQVLASGGLAPYGYIPAQTYEVTVPHCTTGQGTDTVISADRQTAQASWLYRDVACP